MNTDWKKYDQNDPTTFPQEAGYYIVAVRDWHKRDRVSVFYYAPDDPRESWWALKVVCYKRLEMPPEEMFPPTPMPPITPWWSDAKVIRAKMKREREKAAREANFTLCSPKK